jgi:hypothetical protein
MRPNRTVSVLALAALIVLADCQAPAADPGPDGPAGGSGSATAAGTAWNSPEDAREFARGYRRVLAHWGGTRVEPST